MKFDFSTQAKKTVQAILSIVKVNRYDLCICGSRGQYAYCCGRRDGTSFEIWDETLCEDIKKYIQSPHKKTNKTVVPHQWEKIEAPIINALPCLFAECKEATTNCHLVAATTLRKNFGETCLYNYAGGGFERNGVGKAGSEKVFCNSHDGKCFKVIDTPTIDFKNDQSRFLLAYKAVAFSLRTQQLLLGIEFHLRIYALKWQLEAGITAPKVRLEDLQKDYLRFQILNNLFESAHMALLKEEFDHFNHFYRRIPFSGKLFFSGVMDASHDLEGKRLNTGSAAPRLTCNVFTQDGELHVIGSNPSDAEVSSAEFFKQLADVEEHIFVNVLNNILSSEPAAVLILPSGVEMNDFLLEKKEKCINNKAAAFPSKSKEVFDLKSSAETVDFLELSKL